jgi:hypothetical protein
MASAVCSGGLDRAEATTSSTFVTHQHNGSSSSLMFTATPAVTDIGTSSFFAHGMQIEPTQILFDTAEVLSNWNVGL